MQQYADALTDAEELSKLQPTCSYGYYWQCVALQGSFHLTTSQLAPGGRYGKGARSP